MVIGPFRRGVLCRMANFDKTLTAYNFGQNGQNEEVFGPIIKPARSGFGGKKLFPISTHFAHVASQNVSLPSNLHLNMPFLSFFYTFDFEAL